MEKILIAEEETEAWRDDSDCPRPQLINGKDCLKYYLKLPLTSALVTFVSVLVSFIPLKIHVSHI